MPLTRPETISDLSVVAAGATFGRTIAARAADIKNIKDWDGKGDGTTNDNTAFSQALAQVPFGGYLYLPHGTYLITQAYALNIKGIIGEPNGPYNAFNQCTVIKVADSVATGSIDKLFTTSSGHGIRLENVVIDCNNRANYGVHCTQANSFNSVISRVSVLNAILDGFYFDRCQTARFYALTANGCGRDGLSFVDCNATAVYGLASKDNGRWGVNVESSTLSAGMHIYSAVLENYTATGSWGAAHFKGLTTPAAIRGGWIEYYYGSGLVFENNRFTTVSDMRIAAGAEAQDTGLRAGKFVSGSFNNVIEGCSIGYGESTSNYGRFFQESGSSDNIVRDNYYLQQSPGQLPVRPVVEYTDRIVGPQLRVQLHGTAPPVSGTWKQGDIMWNLSASNGGAVGWVCTTGSSTGGTWKTFGTIST